MKIPEIQHCFKTKTAYKLNPTLLNDQFKTHFSVAGAPNMDNPPPQDQNAYSQHSPELTSYAPPPTSSSRPLRDPVDPRRPRRNDQQQQQAPYPYPLPPRDPFTPSEPRDPRLFQVPPPPPGSSYSMHYPAEPELFAAPPARVLSSRENYYHPPSPSLVKDEQPDLVVVFDRPGRSEERHYTQTRDPHENNFEVRPENDRPFRRESPPPRPRSASPPPPHDYYDSRHSSLQDRYRRPRANSRDSANHGYMNSRDSMPPHTRNHGVFF